VVEQEQGREVVNAACDARSNRARAREIAVCDENRKGAGRPAKPWLLTLKPDGRSGNSVEMHFATSFRRPAGAGFAGRSLPSMLLVSILLVSSCAGGPVASADERTTSETVTITDPALLPAADVHLPMFGTVVFRNLRAAGTVTIDIARPYEPSATCSTALGFAADGDHSIAQSVPPHGIAALCFHEAGQFPFVVRGAGGEQHGTVVVGEAR
jgi:hypothetical protein